MLSWVKYILKGILKKKEYWCPTDCILYLVFCCSDKHEVPVWTLPVHSEVSAGTFVPLDSVLSICLFIWMIPVCGMSIHPAWISGRMKSLVSHAGQRYSGCFLFQNLHGMDVFWSLKKNNVNSCKHKSPFPSETILSNPTVITLSIFCIQLWFNTPFNGDFLSILLAPLY